MQGFCDRIARQYDNLVAQTPLDPAVSSTEFVTPSQTDLTGSDSWLELEGSHDEPIVPTDHSITTESGLSHGKCQFLCIEFSFFSGISLCCDGRK